MRLFQFFTITALLAGQDAVAQRQLAIVRPSAPSVAVTSRVTAGAAAPVAANGSGAFVLEAVGGSLGSLAGIAIVGLNATCQDNDDLGCIIKAVAAGGALGAVGATIGTTLAARYTGSRRSVTGAAVGAVVGTAAGLGVHALFNMNSSRNLGEAETIPIFVVAQGIGAAIGSRALGR